MAIAAALALPVLLLLYFLKLRRQPRLIGSTLLWRKSIEDLQVNAPFQRLRLSLLFALQLLTLLLILLAIGRPVIERDNAGGDRLIVLIDRSASMQMIDEGETATRLTRALAAARERIADFLTFGSGRSVMVISFARSPRIEQTFTSDERLLLDAVDAIEATDEVARLTEALRLASAFASGNDDERGNATGLPDVAIFSDATVQPPVSSQRARRAGGFAVRAARTSFIDISARVAPGFQPQQIFVNNLGIVDLSARRDAQTPERVELFVRIINCNQEPVTTAVSLRIGADVVAVETVNVPAATEGNQPGEALLTLPLQLPGSAVATVRVDRSDGLPVDNVASIVIPQQRQPRIAIVAPPDDGQADPLLMNLFEAVEHESLDVVMNVAAVDQNAVDLVVFDRAAGSVRGPAQLHFGVVPVELSAVPAAENQGGQRLSVWDRESPLLQHAVLEGLLFRGFAGYQIPPEMNDKWMILASASNGPVMVQRREQRERPDVWVGFELRNSNWITQVSLLIFVQNLIDAAGAGRAAGDGLAYQPGDTVRLQVVSDTTDAEGSTLLLRRTGEERARKIDIAPGRDDVTLTGIERAGVYTIEGPAAPDALAFNVASVMESDVRPRTAPAIIAEGSSGAFSEHPAQQEIWRWLLLAVFVLLIVEWLVYLARSR